MAYTRLINGSLQRLNAFVLPRPSPAPLLSTTPRSLHWSNRTFTTSWSPKLNQSTPTANNPLSNLRILDLTRVLAGPFCTQILADYGAAVLKVEQPGTGDETRQWRTSGETAQMWDDEYLSSTSTTKTPADSPLMSLYFSSVNRNKRSMTLNLKSTRAQNLIKELLDPSRPDAYDIIVHNFLPGKMATMGLDYDSLKHVNPGLIYASVSGYGASGPSSRRAGYDAIALAEAGLLHITGSSESGPTKPGVAIADLCTGLYTHGAILAAVNSRTHNGGLGCKIDASLFESSLSLLINVGLASLNLDLTKGPENRKRGSRLGLGHPNLVPYGGYRTRDGRILFIAANNNRQWKLFCERLSIPSEITQKYDTNDKRVENRVEIMKILGDRFAEQDLREWEKVFEGSGLPYGPINDVVEALEHPQARARDMVVSVEGIKAARDGMVRLIGPAVKFGTEDDSTQKGSAKPNPVVRRNPPLLGEHTDEVLQELEYSAEQIHELRREGAI
ncbi:hypothetical protein H2198_004804 [Neophaeococcomyces mojaviensis]|uniref:Uncharacterized protein n=1 Tax=Neophaeococcomyces mojaviensis TaxID=3383035 RepID=A0ACC3A7N5_9EURO|nr:hypothetical protein H2198_004804 [Knufia sp. JES_112]